MLKLVSDENFNRDISRGLFRRRPEIDLVSVQEIGLIAAPDQDILAWAAREGRVLLSHDRDTMVKFAYDRVGANQTMPGVFLVSDQMPLGLAIDELLLAIDCLAPDECVNLVKFFPL